MVSQVAKAFLPGFELTVERGGEMVEPDPGMVEPRPSWHYVDRQGHGHFYQDRDETYPTLTWIVEPCTMGHGEDCTSEGHYECKLCGEEIRPGTQPAKAIWIDGPNTYRLRVADGSRLVTYAFGEDRWSALQEAFLEAVRDTLGEFVAQVEVSSA